MSTAENSGDSRVAGVLVPLWERCLLKCVGEEWRPQLSRQIAKRRAQGWSEPRLFVFTLRQVPIVTWGMAVNSFSLALLVADILVFAVVIHSVESFAVLVAVVVALTAAVIGRGHFSSGVKDFGEALMVAVPAMGFFTVTLCCALFAGSTPVPASTLFQWDFWCIGGLVLTAATFYFPFWKNYTPAQCAFIWTKGLNIVWVFEWFLLQGETPLFTIHWLCPALTGVPIFLVFLLARTHVRGFKQPTKDDSLGLSIRANVFLKADLERKRAALLCFKGYWSNAGILFFLLIYWWAVLFRMPDSDHVQLAISFGAGFMLFGVWEYIRRANVRADELLEAEQKALA